MREIHDMDLDFEDIVGDDFDEYEEDIVDAYDSMEVADTVTAKKDANVSNPAVVMETTSEGIMPMYNEDSEAEDEDIDWGFDESYSSDGVATEQVQKQSAPVTAASAASDAESELAQLSRELLGGILCEKGDWEKNWLQFKSSVDKLLFKNEDFLIANVLCQRKGTRLQASRNFRNTLKSLKGNFSKYDGGALQLSAYAGKDISPEEVLIQETVRRYEIYQQEGMPVEAGDYIDLIESYKIVYRELETIKCNQTAIDIITKGIGKGTRRKYGVEDADIYVKQRLAEIEGLVNTTSGKGFIKMTDLAQEESEDTEGVEILCGFEEIPTLNESYKITTDQFSQIMGPPKMGKSKLSAKKVHDILRNGYNVSVWPVEGGVKAWFAQLRAIHCWFYYNDGKSSSETLKNLPSQGEIVENRMTEEQAKLEAVSKNDLLTRSDFGSVEFIDRPFLAETFLDEIETSVSSNNSKFVLIDYMQLIGTTNPKKPKHEVVQDAYIRLLPYCKKRHIGVMTPVQLKQEVVSDIAKGDIDKIDFRTAAGTSAEVIRTPDATFALLGTEAELDNNMCYIKALPNRFGKVTGRIPLDIDLAHSIFAERVD